MSLPIAPLTLLIDGNNLAHFLYTNLAPGTKMGTEDSLRLIRHLNAYARTYADQLQVDLCLDRSPGLYDLPVDNLLISYAEYPQTGDDLLLGRFWFYQMNGRDCLVITNDSEILEEVSEAGGASLKVYDFVRRPGVVSPVFRAPDELPIPAPKVEGKATHAMRLSTSIYFRIVEEDRVKRERNRGTPPTVQAPVWPVETPLVDKPSAEVETVEVPVEVEVNPAPYQRVSEPEPSGDEEPYYFLSMDTWPVAEGVRFLLNSFCKEHSAQLRELMQAFDLNDLRAADLRALAELLLHTCGNEADFARRGALMARVRLALLQARGDPLALSELADRTGIKLHGLRGRIRQKAAPWVEIIY